MVTEGQTALTFRAASERLSQQGIHAPPPTLILWAKRGIKTSRGRVYLAATKLGLRYYTTEQSIRDFARALTFQSETTNATPGTEAGLTDRGQKK